MNYLINGFSGFCMALADSVPGVSGGTIAFVLGFYDKFISSLDDLFRGKIEQKKNALKFLVKIGVGWVIGFLLAAKSIFRFGELSKAQEIKTTEYVLIGTLASFTIAILIGFTVLQIIK